MLCEDYAEIVDEEDADYSSPTRDFELDRSRLDLVEIIGEGQFGDVFRGIYSSGQEQVGKKISFCKNQAVHTVYMGTY
jgi:focal adhesion kinase 1